MTSIKVPKRANLHEMLCTYKQNDAILHDQAYMGAVCGAFCNRIKNAQFELNERVYTLDKNENEHCLHGGKNAISNKFWSVVKQQDNQVIYKVSSAHLEDGFPGNRDFYAEYTLHADNSLRIDLYADTDCDTAINMTSHGYFNLGEENAKELFIKIKAKQFLEKDQQGLPTGSYVDTEVTGFDLSQWQQVQAFIADNQYPQIAQGKGVDHCFVVDKNQDDLPVAELMSKSTQIKLSVYSDQNAVLLYTGKELSGDFQPYEGLCFECQGYNDAINHAHFPSAIVKAGTRYRNSTRLCFD